MSVRQIQQAMSRRETRVAIGERILLERKRKDVSQKALADRLGLDPSQVSRIESGSRRLMPEEASIVAQVLGLPLVELLDVELEPEPSPEAA